MVCDIECQVRLLNRQPIGLWILVRMVETEGSRQAVVRMGAEEVEISFTNQQKLEVRSLPQVQLSQLEISIHHLFKTISDSVNTVLAEKD